MSAIWMCIVDFIASALKSTWARPGNIQSYCHRRYWELVRRRSRNRRRRIKRWGGLHLFLYRVGVIFVNASLKSFWFSRPTRQLLTTSSTSSHGQRQPPTILLCVCVLTVTRRRDRHPSVKWIPFELLDLFVVLSAMATVFFPLFSSSSSFLPRGNVNFSFRLPPIDS